MNIACAFRGGGGGGGGGNSLYRSLSTGHDSSFMRKHFRCKVYTGGQLSLGVPIVKKAEFGFVTFL